MLFAIWFRYKHCNFLTALPTRQDDIKNRDKAYFRLLE